MKTILIKKLDEIKKIDDLTLCLGFFDALHEGHLTLIKEALKIGGKVGVLTFSKNPRELLLNQSCKIVNTLEMKLEILEQYHVDYFIILDLSWDILNLTKEQFIDQILLKLGTKRIICGFDYTYGTKGEGKANDLVNSNLFVVKIIEEIKNEKNQKISSTLIHQLIKEGDIESANRYLTRPYKIVGVVDKGFQIGRVLNFKTANIKLLDNFELPSNGVYATKIYVDGKYYNSMTNVGTHPTINELKFPKIETFIFDFDQDIYNLDVKLEFYKKTRNEIKFSSLEKLKEQLVHDEKEIRSFFK